MAFKLPQDIETDLQNRFPGVHVPTFIDALFQAILSKVTKHADCTIREFGKFTAFVSHSKRLSKNIVKFKFRISTALNDKLKSDDYLIRNLPVKAATPFNDEHKKNVADKQEKKQANVKAKTAASSFSRKKTDETIVANEIARIVGHNPN